MITHFIHVEIFVFVICVGITSYQGYNTTNKFIDQPKTTQINNIPLEGNYWYNIHLKSNSSLLMESSKKNHQLKHLDAAPNLELSLCKAETVLVCKSIIYNRVKYYQFKMFWL